MLEKDILKIEGRKMQILISACLAGKKCRYDGNAKPNSTAIKLYEAGQALLVCPEVDGGMPTPRLPSEIVKSSNGEVKVISRKGCDVTSFFQKGAEKTLEKAKSSNIKTALLKAKSPSCGCGKIYDGTFSGRLVPGNGLAADLLLKNGIKVFTEENTEKLLELINT